MLVASSKDAFRKKLVGIGSEIQATDLSEIDHAVVLVRVFASAFSPPIAYAPHRTRSSVRLCNADVCASAIKNMKLYLCMVPRAPTGLTKAMGRHLVNDNRPLVLDIAVLRAG